MLGLVLYPLRRLTSIAFLLLFTATLTLAHILPPGRRHSPTLYLLLFAGLGIGTYLFQIVESTVTGDDLPPKLTFDDWSDAWDDLVHYVGGLFVAYLPVIWMLLFAAVKRADHLDRPDFQALLAALGFVGTCYFPMALLLNGFTQRWGTAFNFTVGFRGMWTMGLDYVLCAAVFIVAQGAWIALEVFWVRTTDPGFTGPRFASAATASVTGLYLSIVSMRVLGLLYRKYAERLAWSIGEDDE